MSNSRFKQLQRIRVLELKEARTLANRPGGGGGSGSAWVQGGNAFGALGVLGTTDNNALQIITNNVARMRFDTSGNLVPIVDNTGGIGTPALRFNLVRAFQITSGDLRLQNDDGTADWIFKEQPDRVVVLNVVTGKRYKLLMEEDDGDVDSDFDTSGPHPKLAREMAIQEGGMGALGDASALGDHSAAAWSTPVVSYTDDVSDGGGSQEDEVLT